MARCGAAASQERVTRIHAPVPVPACGHASIRASERQLREISRAIKNIRLLYAKKSPVEAGLVCLERRLRFVKCSLVKLEHFADRLDSGDLWVFGYGSLMWSPGFTYREKALARVHGYHRALCILSTRYRGTHRRPGLVVGLCYGGSCWGMAFRVDARHVGRTLQRLWSREMPRQVYEPRLVLARLGRRSVRALAFLADPQHPSYVGELDLHGRAKLVAQGIGQRGHCVDYIRKTLDHMHDVGVRDPHLERILHAALALRENAGS